MMIRQNIGQDWKRFLFIWLLLLLAAIGLGARLYYLQVVTAESLQQQAQQQQQVTLSPYIPRRSIVDRNNNILATDRIVYELYAHPILFSQNPDADQQQISQDLAEILDEYSKTDLNKRFEKHRTGIKLADQLREQLVSRIEKLNYSGLELIKKYDRYYPHQELAGNVVGYVQKNNHQGKSGVELTQRDHLMPSVPTSEIEVQLTNQGKIIPVSIPKKAFNFNEKQLQLTLNLELQRYAKNALQETIKEFQARRGTVIVMDPQTGELLTLASQPNYDPNRYFQYDLNSLQNWAITDLYEPGSTFKPINVGIALKEGVITPNTKIYDPGTIEIEGWPIQNYDYTTEGAHGMLKVPEILQVSSNVGMIKIMQRLSAAQYYEQLQALNLEEPVGIELPGETPGQLKSKIKFTHSKIQPATTAFGKGFSLTPIKLAQLGSALANGGELIRPHVVKGLVDQNGKLQELHNPDPKQVFSDQTTEQVVKMMETVVSEGTGETASIPGYRVAGKTGTSHKAIAGGYSQDKKVTSFIGIFPAENPRYVALAVVDNPKAPMAYGATVAAPVVKDVMEKLITIEGIPPTHPEELEKKDDKSNPSDSGDN